MPRGKIWSAEVEDVATALRAVIEIDRTIQTVTGIDDAAVRQAEGPDMAAAGQGRDAA